jgi:hypothetical protein
MNQSICTMEVFVKETYRSMQILENSVSCKSSGIDSIQIKIYDESVRNLES